MVLAIRRSGDIDAKQYAQFAPKTTGGIPYPCV